MLQEAHSMAKADSFKENSLERALEKIVFLYSDGASVNNGKDSVWSNCYKKNTHGFLLSGALATDLN